MCSQEAYLLGTRLSPISSKEFGTPFHVTAKCREDVLEQKGRQRLAKELQKGILYTVFNCIYLPRKWRLSRSIYIYRQGDIIEIEEE